eukprot:3307863-Lingulodinium_polyedra.AAC.1
MYPAFESSQARSLTNAVAIELPASAFAGARALAARPDLAQSERLVPCVAGMIPGDLNAVDFAQDAHSAVLDQHSSYPAVCR